MKKQIIIGLIFICMINFFICFGQSNDSCTDPPQEGPPPDNADDNFSYNLQGIESLNPFYVERYPFVGILRNGNTESMDNLLSKIGRQCLYVDEDFYSQEVLRHISLLIIPTGGLWGYGKSEYYV
jgi:hypothetical protein